MSDVAKTGVYLGVAVLLAVAAFVSRPQTTFTSDAFDDTGEIFFPDFTDPLQATALEVFEYDEETGQTDAFRVEYKNNRWTVPSHENYPADARDRLAKTAGAIIGLTKDAIVSENSDDHAELGVVDPESPGTATTGFGRRVKLYDKSDNVIADLIVGKEVEGSTDFKYMRVPGKDRVYRVKADKLDLSTEFTDWIDTDLLELSSFDIDKITLNDYRVDLEKGRVLDSGTSVLKKNEESKWEATTLTPPLGENEEFDDSKASSIASAIADLKIVDVRQKPEGLKPDLSLPTIVQAALQQKMAQHGFYPQKNTLYSNDGEVLVETKEGLVYTLRFGNSFVSEKEEKKEESSSEETKGEEKKDDKKVNRNRYMLVSVDFNEDRFPPIEEPKEAAPAEEKKDEAESKESNDSKDADESKKDSEKSEAEDDAAKKAEEEKKKQEEELKRKREERENKIKQGKEKAKELTDRYAQWYYVISDEAFEKIKLSRDKLVKEKEKKDGEEKSSEPAKEPAETSPAPAEETKKEMKSDASPAEKKDEPAPATEEKKPAEEKPKAQEAKEEESKAEAKTEEPKAEEPKKEEPKAEEKAESKPAPEPEKKDEQPSKAEEKPAEKESKPEPQEKVESSK